MRSYRIKSVPATTNNITRAIINFLLSRGHSASRINTQGQYDELTGQWRKSGSRKGFFDIAACVFGRFVAIDVKGSGDKLNIDQVEFMKEVLNAGGIAIEIRNYNEFLNWYKIITDDKGGA